MIRVHHLENSRSHRIVWLLEELGRDYEILPYARDPKTSLAPAALEEIHPLGKSPVIEDAGELIFESGAIVDILVRRYGEGRLAPHDDSEDYIRYVEWLHYAEGSAMLPVLMKLFLGRLGEGGAPLAERVDSEIERHFGFLEGRLGSDEYFVANAFSAADVQLSFPIQLCRMVHGIDAFPNLSAFLERIAARPAYRRALERGGPFAMG